MTKITTRIRSGEEQNMNKPNDTTEPSLASAGPRGCNPHARLIVSGSPTIDEYRTALAGCVAEKAADWKAACESAEAASKEITRLKRIIEDYAKITAASSREINGLLRINESLRREIRTQRTEIAALREERRAVIESDRPWRNENPEGGWIP